jgi:hypothetical protein
MMKRVSLTVGIVLLGLILIGAVVVALTWRTSANDKVELAAPLPVVLTAGDIGSGNAVGGLTLRAGGAATLSSFPVGEIKVQSGSICLEWDGNSTFSGAAQWTADDNYMITITSPGGQTLIGPYHPTLSDVVWYKFGAPRCEGNETMWYWAEPE